MPEPIHYDDMVEYLVSVSPAKILSLLSEFEAREADRRRLGLELEGVIIDTEQGYGFDEVCLATVKRVRAALAQQQGEGS